MVGQGKKKSLDNVGVADFFLGSDCRLMYVELDLASSCGDFPSKCRDNYSADVYCGCTPLDLVLYTATYTCLNAIVIIYIVDNKDGTCKLKMATKNIIFR